MTRGTTDGFLCRRSTYPLTAPPTPTTRSIRQATAAFIWWMLALEAIGRFQGRSGHLPGRITWSRATCAMAFTSRNGARPGARDLACGGWTQPVEPGRWAAPGPRPWGFSWGRPHFRVRLPPNFPTHGGPP